jgi:hypothetical protein
MQIMQVKLGRLVHHHDRRSRFALDTSGADMNLSRADY